MLLFYFYTGLTFSLHFLTLPSLSTFSHSSSLSPLSHSIFPTFPLYIFTILSLYFMSRHFRSTFLYTFLFTYYLLPHSIFLSISLFSDSTFLYYFLAHFLSISYSLFSLHFLLLLSLSIVSHILSLHFLILDVHSTLFPVLHSIIFLLTLCLSGSLSLSTFSFHFHSNSTSSLSLIFSLYFLCTRSTRSSSYFPLSILGT